MWERGLMTSLPDENKNVVLRWVEARNNSDLTAALDVWSNENQDVVRQGFTAVTQIFPDIHIIVEDIIAEGDKVVLYSTMHGTHSAPFMDINATGRTVALPIIDIYTVASEKIQSIVRVTDRLEALSQLGVQVNWAKDAPV
jgi:predicted ester cyclase